jgi:SAM-dependent methyltransferase
MHSAQAAWEAALAGWGIPDHILERAPESPWIHPVSLFTIDVTAAPQPTLSDQRALDALPVGGSVLDVGSGGGKAAFALVPPAASVIGVDHQAGMLEQFAAAAEALQVTHTEILGDWPDVAPLTPSTDVVTCHHVAYNVSDLSMFAKHLNAHAKHRVVMELPWQHPLTGLAPAWKAFWNLDRPAGPTADDALRVIREAGFEARSERFSAPFAGPELPFEEQVRHLRIRLCLPPDRDGDVAEFLRANPPKAERDLAVIWWDVQQEGVR